MASGMEQMIAKMLGFTPEQLHETLSGLQGLASGLAETLKRIEEQQTAILAAQTAIMERLENVGSKSNASPRRIVRTGSDSGGVAAKHE